MVGLAIGAAATLASSILGAVGSANATKKANALIDTEKKKNQEWYDTRMGSDYTQRSDMQAVLKRQKELLDAQYNRTAATSAVVGGTDEAVAMQKAAGNQSLADTMTNIAGQASSYKDSVEQQYRQQDAALTQQQIGVQQQKAQQIAAAASQGVQAGLGMMSAGLNSAAGTSGAATNPLANASSQSALNDSQAALDATIKAQALGTPAAITGVEKKNN